ncbi:MAG: hypothetical protein WCO23_03965 [bacterium]
MNKILRTTAYVTVFALFSGVLSGCTLTSSKKPAAQTVTEQKNANQFVVWSFESEDIWKPIKADFESTNKGYTFTYKRETLDTGYETRVLNSILSGLGPDVWAMPNDWVYRHKDKLAPMPTVTDPKTKKTGPLIDIKTSFVPAVAQSVAIGDQVYALTPSIEPLTIYWNPQVFQQTLRDFNKLHEADTDPTLRDKVNKLLAEPPKTWSEITEAIKLLTKKDAANNIIQSGMAMGTKNIPNAQDILYLLMFQNGTQITSDDLKIATFNLSKNTTAGLKDIPGKRAFDFYTSFADPASANYSWNDALGNSIDAFAHGKVAMMFGYGSLEKKFLETYPDIQYRKAYAPQLGQEQYTITDFTRFTAFGVSGISNNIPLAWNFNVALATTYADSIAAANGTITPALKTTPSAVADTTLLQRDRPTAPEANELSTAKTFLKGRNPVIFDKYINDAIAAINSKTRDSASIIDLTALDTTALLKSDEWK